MIRTVFLTLTMAAAFAAIGSAADTAAGKAVYDKSCKGCHGANGTPSAGMAKAMNMKDLKSPDIQAKSDADLKKAITEGKGKMKPMHLDEADLNNVVAYVKSLK